MFSIGFNRFPVGFHLFSIGSHKFSIGFHMFSIGFHRVPGRAGIGGSPCLAPHRCEAREARRLLGAVMRRPRALRVNLRSKPTDQEMG